MEAFQLTTKSLTLSLFDLLLTWLCIEFLTCWGSLPSAFDKYWSFVLLLRKSLYIVQLMLFVILEKRGKERESERREGDNRDVF